MTKQECPFLDERRRPSIWLPCIDCGKERRVRIERGKPVSLRCCSCAGYERGRKKKLGQEPKVSIKRGSKRRTQLPSKYDLGNPHVNLCLAMLRLAKVDNNEMWIAFQKTQLYKVGVEGNIDSLDVAVWVSEFIRQGNDIKAIKENKDGIG